MGNICGLVTMNANDIEQSAGHDSSEIDEPVYKQC